MREQQDLQGGKIVSTQTSGLWYCNYQGNPSYLKVVERHLIFRPLYEKPIYNTTNIPRIRGTIGAGIVNVTAGAGIGALVGGPFVAVIGGAVGLVKTLLERTVSPTVNGLVENGLPPA